MKITLEFDSVTEAEEYDLAFNGHKYARCWDELDKWLRHLVKYDIGEKICPGLVRTKMTEIKTEIFSE